MVENVGVVYPDCERGNKHVPAFAEVVVRNPLTLEPVAVGQRGLVQVCSVLPTSFPRVSSADRGYGRNHRLQRVPLWKARHQLPLCGKGAEGRGPRMRQPGNHSPKTGAG